MVNKYATKEIRQFYIEKDYKQITKTENYNFVIEWLGKALSPAIIFKMKSEQQQAIMQRWREVS